MASSCSHWWHAPIYLTISIFLAAVAISSFQPPSSATTTTNTTVDATNRPPISANATTALRNNGYTIMATLLQFYPQLFSFTSSRSTTVFAIDDTAFSTVSAPPYAMQLLLQYHTVPLKLPFQELLKKHNFSCLPTLLPFKNISLTKIDDHNANNTIVLINNVTLSHPDLFLDDFVTIHGVLGPFSSLDHHHYEIISSPFCENSSTYNKYNDHGNGNGNGNGNGMMNDSSRNPQNPAEWVRMIRALSSSGFVSFAIGLNSIIDQVLDEYPGLGPVTVFAPVDFGFVGSSNWLLDRIVRYHVLSQRYTYSELTALPDKTVLNTLLAENAVQITVNLNVSTGLAVNGVDVVSPDVISTRMFVVHGISRALDPLDHAST